jgi:hypothetical protein
VAPARLHHGDLRVVEVAHDRAHELGLRHEVGVEDGDELALRRLQAVLERAGFVARAIGAVDVHRVDAALTQALHVVARDGLRLVDRVVEHLDLQALGRVVHLRDRIEQARRHRRLVEERQLDRDVRQLVELGLARVGRAGDRLRDTLAVDPAEDHEVQAVQAVGREGQQDGEVDGTEG